MGSDAFKISSTKHIIVTKNSTEAEIVGVSDAIGDNLGLMYFLPSVARLWILPAKTGFLSLNCVQKSLKI